MVAGKRPLEEEGSEPNTNTKRYNTGNQPLLKLLVPNYIAGALIGKGGGLITEMKEKYGGNIRLSANGEVYPGTDERIVVLTGEVSEIMELNNCIMEKVESVTSKQPVDDSRRQKAKIVLTNGAAGLLIGRGGLTIKAIQEESKARISICNSDVAAVPGERVLTMMGSMEQRVAGAKEVIEKISADASNMANTQLKYGGSMSMGRGMQQGGGVMSSHFNTMQTESRNSYTSMSTNPMSALSGGASNMRLPNQQVSPSQLKTKVEIQLEVPDVLVGPILGKQGQIIREIAQRSGARLKFSDKNEFAEGTTDRLLTITANDVNQGQMAYSLINERVDEIGNTMNQSQSYY